MSDEIVTSAHDEDGAVTPTPLHSPTVKTTDLTRQYAVLLALQGVVNDMVTAHKNRVTDRLAEVRDEHNIKSFEAKDDTDLLVTFTFKGRNEAFNVTDSEAFTAWVMEHHTSHVDVVTSYVVQPAWLKGFLDPKGEQLAGTEEGVIDTSTGEVVPGLTHIKPGITNTLHPSWAKDGKEKAAAALLNTGAQAIVDGWIAEQPVAELDTAKAS